MIRKYINQAWYFSTMPHHIGQTLSFMLLRPCSKSKLEMNLKRVELERCNKVFVCFFFAFLCFDFKSDFSNFKFEFCQINL